MPTIDGRSENYELLENLFRTNLKINNQLTEEDETKVFSISHAWQFVTNIQKHHQSQQSEFGRISESVP